MHTSKDADPKMRHGQSVQHVSPTVRFHCFRSTELKGRRLVATPLHIIPQQMADDAAVYSLRSADGWWQYRRSGCSQVFLSWSHCMLLLLSSCHTHTRAHAHTTHYISYFPQPECLLIHDTFSIPYCMASP